MYCDQCGQPLHDLAHYCSACGAPVTLASAQTSTPSDSPAGPSPATAAGADAPAVGDAGSLPPMVVPAPGEVGDIPIRVGKQLTLGARVGGRGGPIYFLAGAGALTRRYSRRFPLTPEGWATAWDEFALGDPDAAGVQQQAVLDRVRAERSPQPPPSASPSPPDRQMEPDGPHPHRRPTNALAIAALVMGVWCFTVIGAVLALIFGGIALRQIEERGERGGSLARAAIILGFAGLAVGIVGFIVIAAILASATPTPGPVIVYPG